MGAKVIPFPARRRTCFDCLHCYVGVARNDTWCDIYTDYMDEIFATECNLYDGPEAA